MKSFRQWAKDKNFDLSFIENTKRGGIHTAYPSGYVRSQYPDAYFYPISATAPLDLKNLSKVKDVAPKDVP